MVKKAVIRPTQAVNSPGIARRRLGEIVLAVIGIIVLSAGFVTNNGSMMSALLVLTGISILSISVMFYFFSPSRVLRTDVCDAISLSNSITINKVLSAAMVNSNGVYVPAVNGRSTKVYLPLASPADMGYAAPVLGDSEDISLVQGAGAKGIYLTPPGEGLFQYAKSIGASFYVDGLEKEIRDVLANSMELAAGVKVKSEGKTVKVEMKNIANSGMCASIRKDNSLLCSRAGCPICSLVGCMVAESFGVNARVDSVTVDRDTVKLTYELY